MREAPPVARYDRVIVEEQGLAPWTGVASTIKWSPGGKRSIQGHQSKPGWRIEVRRDDDGMTWTVPAELVRREER